MTRDLLPSTSQHGACTNGDAAVRDALPADMDPRVAAWVRARLDAGEQKYKAKLLVGWDRAREALREELADGIAYAVAANRADLATALSHMLVELLPEELEHP